MKTFVAIDTETTGLCPHRGDRVIEIAAVKVIEGIVQSTFQSFISCSRCPSPEASKVNGITSSMLLDQPGPKEVFTAFNDFVGRYDLIAHNAAFDKAFLEMEFDRLGLVFEHQIECTYELAKLRLPKLPSYSLQSIAQYLIASENSNVDSFVQHRALSDAQLVALIMLELENF